MPRSGVFVSLNGETAATLTLRDATARVYTMPLPAGLRGSDRITFDLPDGGGSGADTRRLGVALHWLRFDAFPTLTRGRPLDLGSAEGEAFLGEGWGEREGNTRWTAALAADVVFAADPAAGTVWSSCWRPSSTAACPHNESGWSSMARPWASAGSSGRRRRPGRSSSARIASGGQRPPAGPSRRPLAGGGGPQRGPPPPGGAGGLCSAAVDWAVRRVGRAVAAADVRPGRKVRTPRAVCWLTASGGDPRESATENTPPNSGRKAGVARVKRCGKSAPPAW